MRILPVLALLIPLAAAIRADEVGLLVRFGLTDKEPAVWDGSVSVSAGKVDSVTGWRFQLKDEVSGLTWKASTRPLTVRRTNAQKKTGKTGKKKGSGEPMADNGVILHLTDVTNDSVVTLRLPKGEVSFSLSEVSYQKSITRFEGAVEIERVAATAKLRRPAPTTTIRPW